MLYYANPSALVWANRVKGLLRVVMFLEILRYKRLNFGHNYGGVEAYHEQDNGTESFYKIRVSSRIIVYKLQLLNRVDS